MIFFTDEDRDLKPEWVEAGVGAIATVILFVLVLIVIEIIGG